MIAITRSLARQFRAVARKAGIKIAVGQQPLVHFVAAADGLRVRAKSQSVAVEHFAPGNFPAEEIAISIDALADFEGRGGDLVELEASSGVQRVTAKWTDRGIPQLTSYEAPEKKRASVSYPPIPQNLASNGPELWPALRDACKTAAVDSTRYALNCLQLRGDRGQIVATDGQQVLRQSGFTFSFKDTLLIPVHGALGCQELAGQDLIQVGRTEDWLTIVAGAWTLHLRIEKEARYPRIDDIVSNASAARAQVQLSDGDAEYLIECLPRLPGNEEQNRSVTLDLSQYADVRAKGQGQEHATQVLLSNTQTSGEPIAVCTNRMFLQNALRLGFREINLFTNKSPVLCDDGRRQYLWALLDPAEVVKRGQYMTCLQSPLQKPRIARMKRPKAQEQSMAEESPPEAKATTSPTSAPTLQAEVPAAVAEKIEEQTKPTAGTPLAQALAMRAVLREALALNGRLIADIRRHKKQSRLVDSTLAALKQLRAVA